MPGTCSDPLSHLLHRALLSDWGLLMGPFLPDSVLSWPFPAESWPPLFPWAPSNLRSVVAHNPGHEAMLLLCQFCLILCQYIVFNTCPNFPRQRPQSNGYETSEIWVSQNEPFLQIVQPSSPPIAVQSHVQLRPEPDLSCLQGYPTWALQKRTIKDKMAAGLLGVKGGVSNNYAETTW